MQGGVLCLILATVNTQGYCIHIPVDKPTQVIIHLKLTFHEFGWVHDLSSRQVS